MDKVGSRNFKRVLQALEKRFDRAGSAERAAMCRGLDRMTTHLVQSGYNAADVRGKDYNPVKNKWVISVGGYGTFFFDGSEKKAEEMRKHKANWEQGIGRKRPATVVEVRTKTIDECKNHPLFKGPGNFLCKCDKCK